MSWNRWHAPHTCWRVNGRVATIYKAGGEGKKPKEKERWETEDKKKGEKREREKRKRIGEREREREKEGTPRNYARVSYGGTSTAVIRPEWLRVFRLSMTAHNAFQH